MNADRNNKNLDELITKAIGRDGPKFDFDKWQKDHKKEIETFKSQTAEQEVSRSVRIFETGKIIMKSPITKLAAAAVLIIVVILVLNQFGTPIDTASTAFAKVIENTNQMPWMHVVATLEQHQEHKYIAPGGFELWFNISSEIYITIGDYIKYEDYKNKIRYFYSPEEGSLQISNINGNWEESVGLQSNSDLLNRYLKFSSQTELQSKYEVNIEKSKGEYQEKKVDIYTFFIKEAEHDLYAKMKFIVDPVTNLVIVILQRMEDLSGQHIADAEITFSYPDKGPKDIYEAGASRDAKVIKDFRDENK